MSWTRNQNFNLFNVWNLLWPGARWKEAFDFVKQRRKVCAPNTAFTCNLIEIDELLSGDAKTNSIMLRCSSHLPHDNATPVLKMCRHSDSRKFVTPTTSVLDPSGNQQNIPYVGERLCQIPLILPSRIEIHSFFV